MPKPENSIWTPPADLWFVPMTAAGADGDLPPFRPIGMLWDRDGVYALDIEGIPWAVNPGGDGRLEFRPTGTTVDEHAIDPIDPLDEARGWLTG